MLFNYIRIICKYMFLKEILSIINNIRFLFEAMKDFTNYLKTKVIGVLGILVHRTILYKICKKVAFYSLRRLILCIRNLYCMTIKRYWYTNHLSCF